MGTIFFNAMGLFGMIFLGFLLKKIGLLEKKDGSLLSKIILNVTLPAAIIMNLATTTIQKNALLLILVAIVLSLIQVLVAFFVGKKQDLVNRQFLMYCGSGYNIGNFAIPFSQSFFAAGIPLISIFDMGNSIMLAGGTTIFIEFLIGQRTRFEPGRIILNLLKSPSFTCYLLMLVLGLSHITLPLEFIGLIAPIGNANTFLSMFMIGLFLEFRLPQKAKAAVLRILAIRYGLGIFFLLFFYFLPLLPAVKIILCLLMVAPIPLFGVINSVLVGMEEEAVGFVSSVSFLISLPAMTAVLLLFGLA